MLLVIAIEAVECSNKKTGAPFVDAPVFISTPVIATPSPDKQVLSSLFDDIHFELRDNRSLNKNFSFQYILGGESPTVEIKNDLRYYIAKDTGTVITIKISHMGKQYQVNEGDSIRFNGVRLFTFEESITCDSIGKQSYFIQVYMSNKWSGQFTQLNLDSWDIAIKQKVKGQDNQ